MQTGKLTNESEGVKWYALVTIIAGVLLVVLWMQWLNSRMGGGGSSSRRNLPGSTPLVLLTPGSDTNLGHSGAATPYQLGGKPTRTPVPTATAYRLGPTTTPRPAPTAGATATTTSTPRPAVPTVVVLETPVPTQTPAGRWVWISLSTYWPDDGPDWCLIWDETNEQCVSPLTSGDDFRAFEGRALACDPAWLGQTLVIPELDLALPCLDTGISFRCVGGPCTVGLLTSHDRDYAYIAEGLLVPHTEN